MSEAKTFRGLAQIAYAIWRGEHMDAPHWDDLPEQQRDALTSVYFLGQLDRQEELSSVLSQSS